MKERLEELMAERGLTLFRVAKEAGVPYTTLYESLKRGGQLRAATVQKLADYFGVSVEYLLNGSEEERYYEDPLTAELAQKMKDDHDLRLLFSAAKDAKPETLQAVYDVLVALKRREKGDDD